MEKLILLTEKPKLSMERLILSTEKLRVPGIPHSTRGDGQRGDGQRGEEEMDLKISSYLVKIKTLIDIIFLELFYLPKSIIVLWRVA